MRISIKQGLVAATLMMMVALTGTSFTALSGARSLKGASDEIAVKWMPSVNAASGIEVAFSGMRVAYSKHVLSLTRDDMAIAEKAVTEATDNVAAAIERYRPLVSGQREAELLSEIEKGIAQFKIAGEDMLKLSRGYKNTEATKVLNGTMSAAVPSVVKEIAELKEINISGAADAVVSTNSTYSSVLTAVLSVGLIAALIAMASMVYAVKGVSRPINLITASMRRLADGDDQITIPFEGRTDEVGFMASAVEVFRQNALTNKRLALEAQVNRSEAEKLKEAEQLRSAREAEQLRIASAALGDSLKRLAGGDLNCRIEAAFAPEYEPLRTDFNATVDQLSETVSAVIFAVSNIDSGTREIATGATDLSKRTEQQAAALEETAAALHEITENVTSSSRMTEEARNVALSATHSAAASAKVVSNAEDAMQRIEQSSEQISNIIGVIDEIAFQTNLLALNAGVEAARAGEAGKGFAVVAQEVRELAQRSAHAAKEIKGLIMNSTAEVESGVKLVRETGDALKTIGDYITRINSHMDSIATSSREQSTGLSQVSVAVNQMDQTTQQNAAMVEESTAAAASLSQEAGKLRDMISIFQLDGAATNNASALRSTAKVMTQPAISPVRVRTAGVSGNLAHQAADWQEF